MTKQTRVKVVVLRSGNAVWLFQLYNKDMSDDTGKAAWTFYYDGDCGFCTLSVRILATADFFGRVKWTAFQELPEPPQGLTWEDLDAAAYLEVAPSVSLPSGTGRQARLYRGYYAIRMLTLRLPPLFPLVPLLWLPGVNRLGEAAYAWVAANRYRISSRCRLKAGR